MDYNPKITLLFVISSKFSLNFPLIGATTAAYSLPPRFQSSEAIHADNSKPGILEGFGHAEKYHPKGSFHGYANI